MIKYFKGINTVQKMYVLINEKVVFHITHILTFQIHCYIKKIRKFLKNGSKIYIW